MTYRPDIDGLRAVAIIGVVFFHAFPNVLPGGFIGVDIFFVISGFLISGVIISALSRGEFTFRHFYARRILRIFPALAVVLGATLVGGALFLLPDEFESLGKHVLGGAGFVSNILLYREVGYFDAVSHAKPLLNLWSLGIEEQFYIIFPLIVWLCWRYAACLFFIFMALCLFSFWDNLFLYGVHPSADFYLPLSRFWELLAGASLQAVSNPACIPDELRKRLKAIFPEIGGEKPAIICAGSGLVLMVLGFFICDNDTGTYPGYLATLPVIGTMLMIAAGPENFLNRRLLSARSSVFVGKISYPLYLWHWPLLSFAYILCGKQLYEEAAGLRTILLLAAFVLAVLTWLYVEIPIRYGAGRRKIPALICSLACLGLLGGIVYATGGFPGRLPPLDLAVYENLKSPTKFGESQAMNELALKKGLEFARYAPTGSDRTIAIVGDSHAMMAFPGIAEMGRELGYNTLLLGRFPDWDIEHPREVDWSGSNILKVLAGRDDIKDVILVLRGAAVYNRSGQGKMDDLATRRVEYRKREKYLAAFAEKLLAQGKRLIILEDNPELDTAARNAVSRKFLSLEKNEAHRRTLKTEALERQQLYLEVLASLGEIPGVTVLNGTLDSFCPGEFCDIFDKDGVPLFWDDNHLSLAGSRKLAREVVEPFFRAREKSLPAGGD